MLHAKKARKFGRTKQVRNALLKSLAVSLIKHGKIQTTEAKAKELRKFIEPLVTKAKVGGISEKRLISSRLSNNLTETKKLVDVIAPKYKSVSGGFTRIIKTSTRLGDSAKMAVIEFV
jgi:large subunit ribosomal protein L17